VEDEELMGTPGTDTESTDTQPTDQRRDRPAAVARWRRRLAGGGSHSSVYAALAANLVIAAAKLAAGLLTGSPAMMSEAAHSMADSVNEVFLLASLARAGRAPDKVHPFGYGMERYFWSFLAAVGIFVTGGCFSLYQGVRAWLSPTSETGADLTVAAVVLALAFLAEGASLTKALSQSRSHDGGRRLSLKAMTAEPALRTVIAEDSTAVVGVVLALGGIGMHALTGNMRWEAVASWAIGLLLLAVATRLGIQAQHELIGQAVDPQLQDSVTGFLADQPEIDAVLELLTMRLGPDSTLLATRVDLRPGIDSEALEDVCIRIKRSLRQNWPAFDHVFLDITDASEHRRHAVMRDGR
jgi:cation diffusion facilitator family transporter